MEIGISTDQMIDVGLNLAGFFAAGLILMLIRSLFSRKKGRALETERPQPIIESSNDDFSSEPLPKESNLNIEYVNLGGVDWRPQNSTRRYVGQTDSKSRKRQNVIRLAREMMAEKRTNDKPPADLSNTEGEHLLSERNIKTQAAGRN